MRKVPVNGLRFAGDGHRHDQVVQTTPLRYSYLRCTFEGGHVRLIDEVRNSSRPHVNRRRVMREKRRP